MNEDEVRELIAQIAAVAARAASISDDDYAIGQFFLIEDLAGQARTALDGDDDPCGECGCTDGHSHKCSYHEDAIRR